MPDAPALAWALPFAALLWAVAVLPAATPRLWHRRMEQIVALGVLALLVPLAVLHGPAVAAALAWRELLEQYVPFISVLFSLYAIAGGVRLAGGPWGRPAGNALLLGLGTLLAGLVGSTAAAMLLIEPLLSANAHRRHRRHLVIAAIILVGNAGGALSPIGNPPLMVGFLAGVPFFWPARHLALPLLLFAAPFLAGFWLLDRRLAATDPVPPPRGRLRLRGAGNLVLLGLVAATLPLQALVPLGPLRLLGAQTPLAGLLATAFSLAAAVASLRLTPRAIHRRNRFSLAPMREVAVLFLGIFVTIAPVLAMLRAGTAGPFAPLLALTAGPGGAPVPALYFLLCGLCSAVLDNTPSWLVFFGLAGGDAPALLAHAPRLLAAISAGAVFWGGLTYLGNAPNLMLRAIAAHRGVRMPGFFAYSAVAAASLLPLLALLTLVFFR
ncbi:MAG: sodium:proton antiporter [Acetobacteraceae bacterium]